MFETQAAFRVVDDVEPMRRVTVNPLHGIGAASILTAVNGSEALHRSIQNQSAVLVDARGRFFERFVTHGKRDCTGLGTDPVRWSTEAQRGSIHFEVSDADDTTEINERLPEFVT